MNISVHQPVCIKEKYQRIYETRISIIYNMVEMIVVILDIYGATAIFLQCCDRQDTQSEEQEMYVSIYGPISTKINSQCSILLGYLFSTIQQT